MDFQKFLKVENYINKAKRLWNGPFQHSYAQVGEDLIIDYACKELGIRTPSYLDIGAFDPIEANNTYFFYRAGGHGVCIEPNPDKFRRIQMKRRRDIVLNVGVAPAENANASYYMMTSPFLNTFSREEADEAIANTELRTRQKIEAVLKIPLVTINFILEMYFPRGVDILSIDTEGYDLGILQSLDYKKFHPRIICVETLRYDTNGELTKSSNINTYLLAQGYASYADTRVNSIFVKK